MDESIHLTRQSFFARSLGDFYQQILISNTPRVIDFLPLLIWVIFD